MAKSKTKKGKTRKSFWRRNLDLLIVFSIFIPFYYAHVFTQPISPFLPREAPFAPFERYTHFSLYPPFASSYFLMLPQNYQPEKYTYPLVMMLHGASSHMYGGKALARPEMRAHFPIIVLIPISPFGTTWARLNKIDPRPIALPGAIDILREVTDRYSVDQNKIYVTGYSLGGIGTYAAVSRYNDIFAAAVPIDGHWPVKRLGELEDIPLWIFHGKQDTSMPAANSRVVADVLQRHGRTVFYTEYPDYGHGSWEPTYDNPKFWGWLLQQTKTTRQ